MGCLLPNIMPIGYFCQTGTNLNYAGNILRTSCFGGNRRQKLLFDPFISPNELAKHIDINTIEADYILLSHGHADHVADAEAIAKRTGATIIGAYEVAVWFCGQRA